MMMNWEKMKKYFLTVLILYLLPFALSAQRTVSGRITDAESGEPVYGASVFITGTTVGASTDTLGNYHLRLPASEGSFRMSVSHVGYQSVFRDIEPGITSQTIHIALQLQDIEEVTVTAKSSVRKSDIDLFWRTILGKIPTKRTIQVINPEAVYYFYNTETKKLTVTCRVPLQFINHETGYRIQYVLNYFTHDYNANVSSWEAQYLFTELESDNYKQKNTWEKNREKIYRVSIASFIKALYHGSTLENGFLMIYFQKQNPSSIIIADAESLFLTTDESTGSKILYIPPGWEVILFCYGKPVTDKNIKDSKEMKLFGMIDLFPNKLQTPGEPVQIFPDGSYRNLLWLSALVSSEPLSGLNMILPVEYHPNDATKQFSENKPSEIIQQSNQPQVFRQDADSEIKKLSSFIQALQAFSENIPHEKVYLHFDNTSYYQGDRIWFKCYVTSAQHQLSDLSKTLYVDLLNPGGEMVDKRILKIENGQCHGDFTLGQIPFYSGFYEVRAYTKYMFNFGYDIIFSRLLPVFDKPKEKGNYEEKNMLKYTRWGIRNFPIKREIPERENKVNLRFFPKAAIWYRVSHRGLLSRLRMKSAIR